MFPSTLIARKWHFMPREFFEVAEASDREPVAVDLSMIVPAAAGGRRTHGPEA